MAMMAMDMIVYNINIKPNKPSKYFVVTLTLSISPIMISER